MPLPTEVHGQWSWVYHPDVITWEDEHKIDAANAVAQLSAAPRHLNEGWLKLSDALGYGTAAPNGPKRRK
jgi:hypothetical protein